MKSTEVYKEINKIIFPNLKSKGFKKTKSGMLGFYKRLKEFYLVIWFQCSQDGFDQFAGSKFIVEIQLSKTNEIGAASVLRERIPFFLKEKDFKFWYSFEWGRNANQRWGIVLNLQIETQVSFKITIDHA